MHTDEHHSFYELELFVLMKVTRHVQNTQKRKLVIFLLVKQNFTRVIKYFSVATDFLFYCDAKYSDTLQWSLVFNNIYQISKS